MTALQIIQKLIKDRGLDLNPPHPSRINWSDLGILDTTVANFKKIIQSHVQSGSKIAIYGDYDVDGICSTAILWQTIYSFYPHVFPHIPDRRKEGYGLTRQGIDHCLSQGAKLIITADSGIVAFDQVSYARSQGAEVIIIDHHESADQLPAANCLIHSLFTSAAGLSYFLARQLNKDIKNLDLAALAVICDLVPLVGINRSIAKYGLEELTNTTRPGLLALYEIAGVKRVTSYHAGFIIGPRLNAAGRLTHALDSLRLLCTQNPEKAKQLAQTLNETNLKRQKLTEDLTQHAINHLKLSDILVVADESYDEGVIGLIAAKLVEKYYRPAIAISVGKNVCKASARSVPDFHITDFLRRHSDLFLGVGGHSMAAGFSFSSQNISRVIDRLSSAQIAPELLVKKERYDLEISLTDCSWKLWDQLRQLEPFGLGNPTPVFLAKDVTVSNYRVFGKTSSHLAFTVHQKNTSLPAVWFNPPQNTTLNRLSGIYFQIDIDAYRGPGHIQLIIKSLVE